MTRLPSVLGFKEAPVVKKGEGNSLMNPPPLSSSFRAYNLNGFLMFSSLVLR